MNMKKTLAIAVLAPVSYTHLDVYKRQDYSSFGGDFGGRTYSFTGEDEGGFSDFFESLFGGRGASRGSRTSAFRGQDYTTEVHLSLRDASETLSLIHIFFIKQRCPSGLFLFFRSA